MLCVNLMTINGRVTWPQFDAKPIVVEDRAANDSQAPENSPNFSAGNYTVYFGLFSGSQRLAVKSGKHSENRIHGGILRVK